MIICSKCNRKTAPGTFCERCGEPLPVAIETPVSEQKTLFSPSVERIEEKPDFVSHSEPLVQAPLNDYYRPNHITSFSPSMSHTTSLLPKLRIDKLCILFENTPGFVRFFFDPCCSTTLENVKFTFENTLTGDKVFSRVYRVINRSCEIPVPFPAMEAGALVWSVKIDCEINFRRRTFEGDLQMAVIRPKEAQKVAENFAIHITNNIHNGNASDVHVNQRAADELAKVATSENPFEELRRIVSGGARSWEEITLLEADEVGLLPEMPPSARTERVTIDLGLKKITFFANRSITFGRTVESNDISLRPTADADESVKDSYRRISRLHCFFEHQGDKIAIYDGRRNNDLIVVPSTGGTYWNNSIISEKIEISSGVDGVISFAGLSGCGAVALGARVFAPCSVCTKCPHADKRWCDNGKRSSLVLSRRDGRPEHFIALWSCFHLADVDPSFRDVVIFRKNGAFAWRRGRRAGWLVPNTFIESEFGIIKVS